MALQHTATGWWQAEAPTVPELPSLDGDVDVDVVVVGGGYTGMWAAWLVSELEPGARVALLEAGRCGAGPSGRNGGFVNALWFSLATLRRRFGAPAALDVARAAQEAVEAVGRWCEEQEVDAWYRLRGYLQVSTTAAHDPVWRAAADACEELGEADASRPLRPEEVRARCASPLFRGGAFYPGTATVQPARLARGLRERLRDRGVLVFERSPARRLKDSSGVSVETPGGRVRAGAALLAGGAALAGARPVRRLLTLTSSHMLITEPVPDVLDELGWTGGECITDCRAMVHYFRTTPDGRIAFGWGGGRIVPGARLGGRSEVDPALVAELERHLLRFFPQLAGRRVEHAWGGPIDVSPTHLPLAGSLASGRVHYAFGYTGNGVGPSRMMGRVLAALALGRRDRFTRLALVDPPVAKVPPEPWRFGGGTVVRRALLRRERLEEEGRRPDPLTRLVAGLPERIGIHIGR